MLSGMVCPSGTGKLGRQSTRKVEISGAPATPHGQARIRPNHPKLLRLRMTPLE